MAPDKKDIHWPNLLVSIVNKIKAKKQRPSLEKICLTAQKQIPGIKHDVIKDHLKEALLQGKLVKLVKNGQSSYDTVLEQSSSSYKVPAREISLKSESQTSQSEIFERVKNQPDKNSKMDFFELDVVWAQMSSYPSWPAMVRCSPENIFEKENKIHVQFFGDLSRAWVNKNKIKVFHPSTIKAQSKSKLKKALKDSIEEATQVYNLPRDEREGYLIPMKADKVEAKLKDRMDQKAEMDAGGQFSEVLVKDLEETDNSHKIMKDDTMDETDDSISIEDMYNVVTEEEILSKDIVPTEERAMAHRGPELEFCNSSLKRFNSLKVNIEKMSDIRHHLESPSSREDMGQNQEPTFENNLQTVQCPIQENESPISRDFLPSSCEDNNLPEIPQKKSVSFQIDSAETSEPTGSASVDGFKRWIEKHTTASNVSPIKTSRNKKRKRNGKQSPEPKKKSKILDDNTNVLKEDLPVKTKQHFGAATSLQEGFSAPGIRRINKGSTKVSNPNDHFSRIHPEVIDVGGETDEDHASSASRIHNSHEIVATSSKSASISSTASEPSEISKVNQQTDSFSSAMKDLPRNLSQEWEKLSESTEGTNPKLHKVELTVTSKQLLGLKLLGFI